MLNGLEVVFALFSGKFVDEVECFGQQLESTVDFGEEILDEHFSNLVVIFNIRKN